MDEAQLKREFKDLFTTKTGQRVLAEFKLAYGDRNSFDSDPLRMAFNEGQRAVYLDLMARLEDHHD